MSRTRRTPADPELTHKLSRRNMLGVAAGATAAALLGATAPAATAADAGADTAAADRGHGRGRPVLPPDASASSSTPCATRWPRSASRPSSPS